ncbi:hypothetical protein [Micromonospora sp. NPDC047527]|uniref:hypothetical protein n=1 Tax=Micromonospora sp. NPDC047527 TaxID=3155144 RepID=UPI0033E433CC
MVTPTQFGSGDCTALRSLLFQFTRIRPRSRADLVFQVSNAFAGSRFRIVDSHNTPSVVLLVDDEPFRMALKAEFEPTTSSTKELRWHSVISEALVDQIRPLFLVRGPRFTVFATDYLRDCQDLDSLVLAGAVDGPGATVLIEKALQVNDVAYASSTTEMSAAAADRLYVGRYEARKSSRDVPHWLRSLYSAPRIVINDKPHLGPDAGLTTLRRQNVLWRDLVPTTAGLSHGDLHCGNILSNGTHAHPIDPRGSEEIPIEYDLGKVFQSIRGGYGSIMHGEYAVASEGYRRYELRIHQPKAYQSALRQLDSRISEGTHLRVRLAEAVHFLSMAGHHSRIPDEALALFLRGVQLLDELLERMGLRSRA